MKILSSQEKLLVEHKILLDRIEAQVGDVQHRVYGLERGLDRIEEKLGAVEAALAEIRGLLGEKGS